MIGMKMPPARAVVLGIAGASSASATDSPYARPSVLFPQAATNMLATRSPRPVFWKPCRLSGKTVSPMSAHRALRGGCRPFLGCTGPALFWSVTLLSLVPSNVAMIPSW